MGQDVYNNSEWQCPAVPDEGTRRDSLTLCILLHSLIRIEAFTIQTQDCINIWDKILKQIEERKENV